MNPSFVTDHYTPNLMEETFKEFNNFKKNLCKNLLQITVHDSQDCQVASYGNINGYCNLEQHLKYILRKRQPHGIDERGLCINIDELVPFFVQECSQNFLHVSPCFASYYLHLLTRDSQDGLEQDMHSEDIFIRNIEQFLLRSVTKYSNPTDATVSCMKISYYCKSSQELQLNFVKEKRELDFKKKLKPLINSILQYPETSNNRQIEDMFLKMQVFIITYYQIGYPENHMLLSQCRQSINSILGKGDIQKYVLKKAYHRLEYLQKLGATAAGILIFNNQGPEGDKENVRNLFADLKMAKYNTRESLQEGFDRIHQLKQIACALMSELIDINIQERNIYCLRPLTEIRELNKYVALFEVYRENLEKIKIAFEKTQCLIDEDQKKFDCVVEKINQVLKYRTAIETEKIFPHFVYLSEIWNSLMLYINHLVGINKIKDHLDDLLSKELENNFNDLLENFNDKSKYLKTRAKHSFQDIVKSAAMRKTELNMLKIKPLVKNYCALTMAVTGGFLLPSQLEKKLCKNVDFSFGFSKMEYAKFAERHFKDFINIFRSAILTCSDLLVLFEVDEEIMQQDFGLIQQARAETTSLDTQTEMILDDKLPTNRVKETWNVWDYHRETIKIANIRKRHTNCTQTNLSFGTRNAQIQCERKSNCATQK